MAKNGYFQTATTHTFGHQQTGKLTLKYIVFRALKTKQEPKKWPNQDMLKKLWNFSFY
jgi:hypothetical protein